MWLTCQSNVDVLGSGVIRCKPINHSIQNPQLISTHVCSNCKTNITHFKHTKAPGIASLETRVLTSANTISVHASCRLRFLIVEMEHN